MQSLLLLLRLQSHLHIALVRHSAEACRHAVLHDTPSSTLLLLLLLWELPLLPLPLYLLLPDLLRLEQLLALLYALLCGCWQAFE